MSVADNFDYSIPTNCRKDLMSLDTINSNDAKIHPFKKMDTQRDWSANLYNLDINSKKNVYTNKVDFINKVDDIERTNPKMLHYGLDKPEYNLSNKDIEKSKPDMAKFHTTRCTNPLEPKYSLPKTQPFPVEIPKFLRDQINISDIKGAKPRPYFKFQTRETFPLDNHGIDGSKPKKSYVRSTPYNYIDYSDLTKDIFKTKRHTNPLDPVYEFKKPNGECIVHGMIEKSKPQTSYPYNYPDPFILRVNDIIGAQTGTKNKINKFNGNNFEMTTNDIKGCCVGSLKKGIVTQRNTNPLNPKYQYLGRLQQKDLDNDPFAKTAIQFRNKDENKSKRQSMSAKPIGTLRSNHGSHSVSRQGSKAPTPQQQQQHQLQSQSRNPTPGGNYSENINIENNNNNFQQENMGHVFNKTMTNFNKPDPYYGLIHDRYVCSSDNPDKRNKIEKNKEDNLTQKAAYGVYNGNKLVTPPEFKEPTQNLTQTNIGNKGVPRNCFSAFGLRGLSNAQKLDKFMEMNKLNYVGEKVALKN